MTSDVHRLACVAIAAKSGFWCNWRTTQLLWRISLKDLSEERPILRAVRVCGTLSRVSYVQAAAQYVIRPRPDPGSGRGADYKVELNYEMGIELDLSRVQSEMRREPCGVV